MHGILALSVLHYAHTNTAQRQHYMVVSARYQQLALKFFSGNINAINNDNCEAYFLLSCIISLLFTFSIGHNSGEQPSPEAVTQSFVLLQGAREVLNSQSLQRWAVGNLLAVLLSPSALVSKQPRGAYSATDPHQSSAAACDGAVMLLRR